ncbi:hypothetical protein SY2F82_39440 [Streptomyces sp. Y2F8-2]|nr:hypothetical protein SY2F82_39440 [Streptomyces sp. Y2F8-2]
MQMPHEAGVDDRDPLTRRHGGEEGLGVTGVGGDPHVEAEGPQIALERRSGDRLSGEDGGRQTNSLPEGPTRVRAPVMCAMRYARAGAGRHVGRGYRMPGSPGSPGVRALINPACAATAAIIIGDGTGRSQTAGADPPIPGSWAGPDGVRRTGIG